MDHAQVDPGVSDDQLANDLPLATVVAQPGVTRYRSRQAAWVLMWIGFSVIVISLFLRLTANNHLTLFGMLRILLRNGMLVAAPAPIFFIAVLATVPLLLRHRNSYAVTAIFRMFHLFILVPLILGICLDPRGMAPGMYVLAAGCVILWISTLIPRVPVPDSSRGFAVDMTHSGAVSGEEA